MTLGILEDYLGFPVGNQLGKEVSIPLGIRAGEGPTSEGGIAMKAVLAGGSAGRGSAGLFVAENFAGRIFHGKFRGLKC